jgi:hypothetical protein
MATDSTDVFSGGDIDALSAMRTDPPPLDFVLPGFLGGTTGILIGSGGAGKSWLALELACTIAGGPAVDLLGLKPHARGRVLYLGLEDPEGIVLHRMRALGLRLSEEQQELIAENILLKSITGRLVDLLNPKQRDALTRCAEGVRLLIVDTLARAHQTDENSNSEMAKLLGSFERICSRTGCAILLVHHTRKGGPGEAGERQHAARGASALVDNARWGCALDRMSEAEAEQLVDVDYSPDPLLPLHIRERRGFYARLSYPKPNYGEPMADRWFRREKGGVLLSAKLEHLPAGAKTEPAAARAASAWRGRPGK